MTLEDRIVSLAKLGQLITDNEQLFEDPIHKAYLHNNWFTKENSKKALHAIASQFLKEEKLRNWIANYAVDGQAKKVGLILAGNIPLVGFHDILATFMCGHVSKIKLSDKDKHLIPFLLNQLSIIDERARAYFSIVDRLDDYEAVIATGSNSSAVHFEYYFKHVPHIIRRNRNAIAVLHGGETREELLSLGEDVFDYFGLGCRNVSKLYVPQGFDLKRIMEALHDYKDLVNHNKYKNNFDYNYAIYLLNQDEFLMNGCLLLKESKDIVSRIAMLTYEYYDSIPLLTTELKSRQQEIQCIVSQKNITDLETVVFGQSQNPALDDYADGVDTINFLINL